MFCPQCGSDNDADKKFCRSCGQSLAAVRLALDGRVEAAIKMSEGEQRLTPHRIRMGLAVFLIAVALATIFSSGRIGFSNVQSAALVLILIGVALGSLIQSVHAQTDVVLFQVGQQLTLS